MREFVRMMKALSDPSRVRIVCLLARRELCVCEVQSLLALAQPTISRHLRILEDAGLVRGRRQGTWNIYRLAAQGQDPGVDSLLAMAARHGAEDPDLQRMLQNLPRLDLRRQAA